MANKPLSMQRVRQILLFLKRGYSEREIAKQTKVSRPTVHLYSALFRATGRGYDELLSFKDPDLDAVFSKTKPVKAEPEDPRKAHFLDQLSYFILELKRVGVTRYLLWQEYLQLYPAGFSTPGFASYWILKWLYVNQPCTWNIILASYWRLILPDQSCIM
jgi:hypothetical protein